MADVRTPVSAPAAHGPRWVEWSPHFAPHVRGRYTPRAYDEDGTPEPQLVEVYCDHPACEHRGEVWMTWCHTGQVRSHVVNYGVAHAHR